MMKHHGGVGSGDDDSDIIAQLGPNALDSHMRQAISMCWMMLPPGKKTIENVEAEIRRIVDRAILNMKEDRDRFKQP